MLDPAAKNIVQAFTQLVMARICFSELIVVDDIGLLPAGEDEAESLYRLVDAAYEKRSLILTSNLHPGRFDTIFPTGLATAAVDRLLHHAHVVVTEGQSTRLADALEGHGVRPLRTWAPLLRERLRQNPGRRDRSPDQGQAGGWDPLRAYHRWRSATGLPGRG